MSLATALSNLNEARKTMLGQWDHVRGSWQDQQAKRFEEQVVERLNIDLKQALEAMAEIQNVGHQAQRACEPNPEWGHR